MTVAALVVTFNRLDLLKRCVAALKGQTRAPEEIIIVDNGSTDGTREWLASQSGLTILLQSNVGSAGGQATGMEHAIAAGYQWVWAMDDDVVPRRSCLERLLRCVDEEVTMVAPRVYGARKGVWEDYHNKRLIRRRFSFRHWTAQEWGRWESSGRSSWINANGFVGPLLSVKRMIQVGLPQRGYFILLDDLEFTYRLARDGGGYLVREAVVDHYDPPHADAYGVVVASAQWKMYYYVRNQLLFLRSHHSMRAAVASFLYFAVGYAVRAIVRRGKEPPRLLLLRYRGMLDGILGRGGKRVLP